MIHPRVFIIGCGYVGSALGEELVSRGCRVWGMRRSEIKAATLKAKGITPLIGDVLEPGLRTRLPQADAVVVSLAPGPEDSYTATYLEAARRLSEILLPLSPERVIWVSSTGIYGQADGSWVDETTPPELNSERSRVLYESEQLLLNSEVRAIVLRFGGIYGPGRDRLRLLQSGRVRLEDKAYINNIHLDDCVGMLQFLLEYGRPGEIYLGVDDAPVIKADFYGWLADKSGVAVQPAATTASGRGSSNKRCSNRKIKALGYRLRYPDYKTGFEAIFNTGK